MKPSILKRIELLEIRKLPKLSKPCLFLREDDLAPENLEDYSTIIRTRVVDRSNYQDYTK